MPYIKNVEKGREEGDTESVGQLQLSPTAESGDPPRELSRGNSYQTKNYSLQNIFFTPLLKWSNTIQSNPKKSTTLF